MSSIRSLRRVAAVKVRRVQQAEERLKAERLALEQAEDAVATAREAMAMRQMQHERTRQVLRDLIDGDGGFSSALVLQRHDQLATTASALAKATDATRGAEKAATAQQDKVVQALRELERCRQQVDSLHQQIDRLRLAAEEADANQADEDAEEAAVSRLIDQARQGEGGDVARL